MLGGCADEGDGAHHGDGIEAGAGEEGRLEEEEGREDGGLGDVEAGPEGVFLDVAVRFVSLILFLLYLWRVGVNAYLSGGVAKVPYMVPMLAARPTPSTTQGFVVINLTLHPLRCSACAVMPMMPIPKPVCIKVWLRYSRSKGGMPPSSLVSRLKTRFVARTVPPTMAAP